MGKASKRKWEARISAAVQQAFSSSTKTPFWEKNLFWGPLGVALGIILLVLGYMKDVRWLLPISWLLLLISFWVATGDNDFSPRKRICVFIISIIVSAMGHYYLHSWLTPESLSDSQLCGSAQFLSQRMRDFDRERRLQLADMQKQYSKRSEAAKTQEELIQISKEGSEYYSRWHRDFQYDYDNKLLPEAWSLRHQLLARIGRVNGFWSDDEAAFRNVGAQPIVAAANRLEILAKSLCPQPSKGDGAK